MLRGLTAPPREPRPRPTPRIALAPAAVRTGERMPRPRRSVGPADRVAWDGYGTSARGEALHLEYPTKVVFDSVSLGV